MSNKKVVPSNKRDIDDLFKKSVKQFDVEATDLSMKDLDSVKNYSTMFADISDEIVDIFPDIQLAIEIVTSLIQSPNDMGDTTLHYNLDNLELPTSIKNVLNNTISTYIEKEYDIIDKLDTIITESLYTRGAYVEVNLPINNVTDILKSIKTNTTTAGVENIITSKGFSIRGSKFKGDDELDISSNPFELVTNSVYELQETAKVHSALYGNINGNSIVSGLESIIIDNGNAGGVVNNVSDSNKPVIIKIDVGSIVPITSKGDNTKHMGYFVFLNGDSKPMSSKNYTPDDVDKLITKTNKYLHDKGKNVPTIKDSSGLRDKFVKDKLTTYLKETGSSNTGSIEFKIEDSLLLTITESIISKSSLKVVYMPPELVSYYAVNFRKNGTGQGLLEKIRTLASIRAMLLFTNILSYIKSSVTTTNVKVDLDPDDPNYRKNMKVIMADVINNRQSNLPIGMLKVDDFVDWIHKLGISFNFKHPAVPDVNIDISEDSNDINPIDTNLKEIIDKQIITSLYLTPEIIDNSYSPDFATSVVSNNLLLSKRISKLQQKYGRLITTDIHKKLKLDGTFISKLSEVLDSDLKAAKKYAVNNTSSESKEVIKGMSDDEFKKWLTFNIINSLNITLTKPEVTEDSNDSDMFSKYKDTLDDIIDYTFSTDMIPSEYMGDLGDKVDDVKSLVKNILMRKFVSEKGMLKEFTNMFTLDEEGKPIFDVFDEYESYLKAMGNILLPFLKDNVKQTSKLNKKLDKIENGTDEEEEEPVDVSDSDTGDTTSPDDQEDTPDEDSDKDASEPSDNEAPDDTDDAVPDDNTEDVAPDDAPPSL